uniref:Uncharacterized protein n=1 Tax=viral metagenome TaxID=1070528 RepID=A0A6M3L9S3_9ZZZZ
MIDYEKFEEAEALGKASIIPLEANFPEAAMFAIFWKKWDENGVALPDEVIGIRLMDYEKFRDKIEADAAWLARLEGIKVTA